MNKIFVFVFMLGFFAMIIPAARAQVDTHYEVASWRGFKKAAVTYTFDGYTNSSSKQLSVALPLFDKYNYKVTLYTITSWIGNWSGLKAAATNGHEISSLTVTHNQLDTQTTESQDYELRQSQNVINANIKNAKCLTLAYPYCVAGDLATVKKYYIAGRICSGVVEPRTPADLYRISSIITGTAGSVKTAGDLNGRVSAAKTSGGWCVFLIHGIDNDGGYSPIPSSEISLHLDYMNSNAADFWVATYADAVRYIRERNAVSLVETPVTADSLLLVAGDNLPDSIYNVPLTIRRKLPSEWQHAKVSSGSSEIASSVTIVGTEKYIVFDVIPDDGVISIARSEQHADLIPSFPESQAIKIHPNPFSGEIKILVKGEFFYSIFSVDGKLACEGNGSDTMTVGKRLHPGTYLLQISCEGQAYGFRIVKEK